VLRDVGRVLEMPYGQVDRLCKLVPQNPANPVTLAQAIEGEPRLQAARDEEEQVRRLLGIALQLEGLYRHASTHAAGMVIGDRPLDELVPLYRDPRSSMPVTQFSMKYVEAAGLVKFDFLGLKTLTVLERGWKLLKARGLDIDPAKLPLDDKKTFELLSRGDTVGVFQLEGSGMRDMLRKFKPDRFEDIIAIVALYRPGPMDNIPKFIACKHGAETPDYLYPSLKPLLEETYGVIVYQEQVMQIAQILSGYSLGEADLLRRAMGKKIKSEMDAQKARFIDGAREREVPAQKADHIFELVQKFAGYGFNKSHAAAYAVVAYQTAWMKANHPVEFLAASMSLDLGNTDKLNVFRQELGRLRIPLRKPDVNRSAVEFSVEHDDDAPHGAVRYALAAVKGVGPHAMQAIVAERERAAFTDLFDFARRVDPKSVNKRMLEALVKAGAFDVLNNNRAQSFAAIETLLRHAGAAAEERQSQQVNLFGNSEPLAHIALPNVAEWVPGERLHNEFEAIGFYLSAHPLDEYAEVLQKIGARPYAQVSTEAARSGGIFKLAGTVLSRQERRSQKGNRFAFVQLSDPTGVYEITVFSELLSAQRELLEPGQSLAVTVEARPDGDGTRFTTQSIAPLDKVAEEAITSLKVYMSDERPIDGIKTLLKNGLNGAAKGRCDIQLIVTLMEQRWEIPVTLKGRFSVSPQIRSAIKSMPGVDDVRAA
jgi:DNA polymerase III subunit alpha